MSLWDWLPIDQLTGGDATPHEPWVNALASLTPRQTEVLMLMARGQSNKEIARHLHLLDGTIKMHAKVIFARLGVRNRAAAAARYTSLA